MSKPNALATFFLIVLLCSSLSQAARHEPAFYLDSKAKNHNQKVVTEQQAEAGMEEGCEGVGEEECLTRRTLVAHLDYVYTNKHKP